MASTYSGIMDLEVCREWMRFPAECRQSRDRIPQSMCWRIPALGAQLEEKDPSRSRTGEHGVPEVGGGGVPFKWAGVVGAEMSGIMAMAKCPGDLATQRRSSNFTGRHIYMGVALNCT